MRFHTSLPVANIEATVSFYAILFDAEPVKVRADYAKFLTDGLNISFHESAEAARLADELHLGFELPDQAALDAVHRRLSGAGLISTERETSICCYANQDKFWVTDPDGYRWELYQLLEDTGLKKAAASQCCPVDSEPSSSESSESCC